ncbi:MAG: hypothetical protein WBV46_22330 [Terriglobales bacterium]
MKAPILYRVSSVLLLIFATGHTLGFRNTDPKWGVDSLIGSMRSIHFDVQGFSRSYWDFYVGFGLFVTVFLVFAAVLSWQLGNLAPVTLAAMRGPRWTLVVCFASVTILNWRYFFIVPVVFAIVITVCLTAAASTSSKTG